MWNLNNIEESEQRRIDKYKRIMDENSQRISDIETINDSLMVQLVKSINELDRKENIFSSYIVKVCKIWDKHDEREKWFKDRLWSYLDLKVKNVKCISQGYGTDVYIIQFDFNDRMYQLGMPNLKNVENYQNCYGGHYRLNIQSVESDHVWELVDGSKMSYYIEDALRPLLDDKKIR